MGQVQDSKWALGCEPGFVLRRIDAKDSINHKQLIKALKQKINNSHQLTFSNKGRPGINSDVSP